MYKSFNSFTIVAEHTRRRLIKRAKRQINEVTANSFYQFYSELMDAAKDQELPVQTELVPEAQEFVGRLMEKEQEEFVMIDWSAANARLQEIYDQHLKAQTVVV